jgi:hypothetical protein
LEIIRNPVRDYAMLHVKTPVAAKRLGVPYHRLIGLLRADRIEPPAKDSSGDYVWSAADIERAREALQTGGRRKAVPA